MARFRHHAAEDGLRFEWGPSELRSRGTQAKLENGDWIHVTPHSRSHHGLPDVWEYTMYGMPITDYDPADIPNETNMSYWSSNPTTGAPGFKAPVLGDAHGVHGFESEHEAKKAAEEHYLSLDLSGRPSGMGGVDYDKFFDGGHGSSGVDFGDFDYGDIFGEGK